MPGWARRTIPRNVTENRRRMAEVMGVAPANFLTLYQIHSPDVVIAERSMGRRIAAARRRHRHQNAGSCDRRHRRRLRPDPVRRSAGPRHRRGACRLEGRADRRAGKDRRCDGNARRPARQYRRRHRSADPAAKLRGGRRIRRPIHTGRSDHARFFVPSVRDDHAMFDLAGFIRMRLERAGVLRIDDTGIDTYSTTASSAIAARCIARSRISAAMSMPSCWSRIGQER